MYGRKPGNHRAKMMADLRNFLRASIVILLVLVSAGAEEAVDWQGRSHFGVLRPNGRNWFVRNPETCGRTYQRDISYYDSLHISRSLVCR